MEPGGPRGGGAAEAAPQTSTPVDALWQEVTFEDIAVSFSREEWSMLDGWQKDLHQEVMLENFTLLLSVGRSIPPAELSSFINQPEGNIEDQKLGGAGGEDRASEDASELEGPWDLEDLSEEGERCLTPASNRDGEHPSSLHLCALMKLVEEIPEFLYGHTKAAGDLAPDAVEAEVPAKEAPTSSVKREVPLDSLHPFGRQRDMAEPVTLGAPSHPGTPASATEGDGQDSQIPADTTAGGSPVLDDGTNDGGRENGAVGGAAAPQATPTDPLARPAVGEAEPNRGGPGGLAQEPAADPGHEPLLNSWKEGGAELPDALGASVGASLSRCSSGGDRPKSLGPRACQEGVLKHSHPSLAQAWLGGPSPNDDTACSSSLSETAAEEKPLQGLLKCLKELIVHQPPVQTSRWNPSSGWQPALRQKMREGTCGSPPGQVKIEAMDEELPAPSLENTAARGGSSPPVAPSCRVSTCQTEGGRRRSRSEAKDRNIFAVVKVEGRSSSPSLQYPHRPDHPLSPRGAPGKERAAEETGVLGIKIKMEETSEDLVQDLKEVPEEERDLTPSLPEGSLSQSSPETGMDLGMWVPYSEAWSPVTSPLHGLLNCLKDIPDPRPQASQTVAGKRGGKERRKGGKRGRLEPHSDAAAAERAEQGSSQCNTPPSLALCDPLPESFLPRGPETFLGESPAKHPRLSPVCGSSHRGPDTEWRKSKAGTSREGHGTPLQGLERCLKEVPTGAHSQPCSPTISSSIGSSPDRLPRRTPVTGKWARKEEGLSRNGTPLQGLERCLKELPLSSPSQPSSPAISGSPDRLHRWTPEAGRWMRREEGPSRNSTPLQGLERCLRELPQNTPSQPWSPAVSSSISSSPDRLHRWTPEPGRWTRKEEGLSRNGTPLQMVLEGYSKELPGAPSGHFFRSVASSSSNGKLGVGESPAKEAGIPPLQGLEKCLKEIPLGGVSCPNAVPAGSDFSAKKPRRTEASLQRMWDRGGATNSIPPRPTSTSGSMAAEAAVEASPLDRLMSCLKEIPIQRPSYLKTPSVSSSASSCSESQSPGCSLWWDCAQDTGSEMEGTLRQKGTESRLQSALLAPEEERGLPSAREPELVTMGSRGPSASPLGGLERCLDSIAMSQPLPSNIPPGDAKSPGDVVPRRSRQGMVGSHPTNPPADDVLSHDPQIGPKDPVAAGSPRPPSTPAQDSSGRTPERNVEGRVQHPQVEAARKRTPSGSCLQGLANLLAERPANPPCRFRPLPSKAQGSSEQREAQASVSSAEEEGASESSPLQGLLRCLKEITARGPSPCSLSSSNSPARSTRGEPRCRRAKGEEVEARRAAQEELPRGQRSRLKERSMGSDGPATTPLSSPQREAGHRSPTPEAGGGHQGSAPSSALAWGSCPKWNGHFCLSSGRSAALKFGAQRPSNSSSPKSGVKRSLGTAQRGEDQTPGTSSHSCKLQGDAESGNLRKKRCLSVDPNPALCTWGNGKPQECRPEVEDSMGPALSKKLDRLSADMSAVCRDVSRLQSHVDRLEQDARGWVLELAALRMENHSLSECVRRMEGRFRALENRSRRNNLRVLGLPEGSEGSDAVAFLQKTLPTLLGLPLEAPPLEIESARRVQGGASWDPSGRPRPLVLQLLRSGDRAAILQAARGRPLSYAGAQITILPDFCSSLSQRRRVPFGTFRRTRWAADLCFGSRHSSCCYSWAPGLREPLAVSGALRGERESRLPRGVGNWGTETSPGPGHRGGCHSAGSCEQRNDNP
ncbi:protein KRBA1 isoform X3 [Podarcis muralis]